MESMETLVVGSRGSRLALRQTQQVVGEMTRLYPGLQCRVKVIKTTGDSVANVPLASIGEKGLFVKEIEAALARGDIDLAVHSAKDLPSEMDSSLTIAAYCEREDPSDALVSGAGALHELPSGARVGTGSARRRAQLLFARPDIRVVDLRGNLDTRLAKAAGADYDAVVLALAGLRRMGWEERVTQVLPFEVCLPAAGQGAVAVQCRSDGEARRLLPALDHAPTRACVTAERALLRRLGAGCQTPVAALARTDESGLRLEALVAGADGSTVIRRSADGDAAHPDELGERLAEELLATPAKDLLDQARPGAESRTIGAA